MPNIVITTDGSGKGTKLEVDGKPFPMEDSLSLGDVWFSMYVDNETGDRRVNLTLSADAKDSSGLHRRISYTVKPEETVVTKDEVVVDAPVEAFQDEADYTAYVLSGELPEYIKNPKKKK